MPATPAQKTVLTVFFRHDTVAYSKVLANHYEKLPKGLTR